MEFLKNSILYQLQKWKTKETWMQLAFYARMSDIIVKEMYWKNEQMLFL